jgi:hypothetical protein
MSQKFSIVIEVGKDGKPVTTGYHKADANKANEHFVRLREAGKEAYFFQHPIADRRSKSAAQIKETLGNRDADGNVPDSKDEGKAPTPNHIVNSIPMPAPKKRGGNKIEGVTLDGATAVDM